MTTHWYDLLFHANPGADPGDVLSGIFALLLAFVIGHWMAWTYMWSHKVLSYSQTFVAAIVILPVLVCTMMMLMSNNIVIAFGLLAVFAVVRFRNVLKDTRDTAFVLWAMTEGMAVGTRHYSTAIMSSFLIALMLLYLRMTAFGTRHRYDALLTVRLMGDLGGGLATVKEILNKHSSKQQLQSKRELTDEGLEFSYRLLLRDPIRYEELKWELETIKDIERVSLFLSGDENEI